MRFPNKPVPLLMPFGSRCTYVPPKTSYIGKPEDPQCKVETRGKPAILVGYYLPPGESSNKEFRVAPLSNFLNKNNSVKIVDTRDARFTSLTYPVRDLRLKQQHELFKSSHNS